MLEKVENYIRQWKMLEKGDKVVVGLLEGQILYAFSDTGRAAKKDRI